MGTLEQNTPSLVLMFEEGRDLVEATPVSYDDVYQPVDNDDTYA